MGEQRIKATVRERYGKAALQVATGLKSGCCGAGSCGAPADDPITSNLYTNDQTATLPAEAVLASLGCGNPTALAELHEGDIVLDLGSGGGIDVLLSARRVGLTGKAYGLDMTDEMLALARENQRKAGVENVEFLKGDIEAIPLPDASVDVIISNCVVNLAADKRRVITEAYRVLKPGGRFAVSDVVIRGEVPAEVRSSMELWVGCIAGALTEREFHSLLWEAGFEGIDIEPTRVYEFEDAKAFLSESGLNAEVLAGEVGGRVMGAFVRATKPTTVTSAEPLSSTSAESYSAPDGRCVILKRADQADHAAVTALLRSLELPTEGVVDWLARYWVACSGALVVGVAGMEHYGDAGLLRSVAVTPEWQGSGVGRALIDRVLEDGRTRGVRDVYLLTTTAEHYFPRLGFACITRDLVPGPVQASVEFTGACPSSAVVMQKRLTED